MANKEIMKTTSNRSVYNKSRKIYLERNGLIKCSRCPYHRVENDTRKWYGEHGYFKRTRKPNWKLVSKNRKQWMEKPLMIKRDYFVLINEYITEIVF